MKLKEILEAKGLKQADLARYLNVRTSLISYYANNDVMPNAETLFKIADYLHVTVDELLGRDTRLINLASLDDNTREVIQSVLSMTSDEVDKLLNIIKIVKS